ncbi:hypothetical protein B2J93_8490 [Marssonina coronariae]|uniref:Uncharacterized protein n=1 Tax=Diplocarpon coronariae TaxID=2795749 RepID=A0A218YV79_9HELO|nr:hypothetical protein B2J93_8490 [Marssonina coronariae]
MPPAACQVTVSGSEHAGDAAPGHDQSAELGLAALTRRRQLGLCARDVAAQRGERFGSGFGLARRRLGSRESPGQFGDRRGCAALRCSALLCIRERNLGAGATSRREECAAVLVFESTRRAQRPSAEDMGSGQGMSGARGEVRIS